MPSPDATTTAILDNGAGLIKAGVVSRTSKDPAPLVAPNALARPSSTAIAPPRTLPGKSRRPAAHLVAAEIPRAPDMTGMVFRRPHDRGIVVAFDALRDVWASVFSTDRGIALPVQPALPRLLLTEALGVPLRVRRATDELVFENFDFPAAAVVPPQRLAAAAAFTASQHPPTCLVLDSGFSSTTAVPIVRGREVAPAARRLALGGKALTNLLKKTVSFRSWNMADETAVMNAVKERCCRVAAHFPSALREIRTAPPVRYVLPDPSRHSDPLGHVRSARHDSSGRNGGAGNGALVEEGDDDDDDYMNDAGPGGGGLGATRGTKNRFLPASLDQELPLRNEQVAIAEALFRPADIGIEQAGVAELVTQAVEACEPDVRADLYANVLLVGGNCLFPGFRARFEMELRPMVASDYDVCVRMEDDPIVTTFRGGVRAVTDNSVSLDFVTRERYREVGTEGLLRQMFGDFE